MKIGHIGTKTHVTPLTNKHLQQKHGIYIRQLHEMAHSLADRAKSLQVGIAKGRKSAYLCSAF